MQYKPWIVEGKTPWSPEEFWAMPWREAERFCKWFVASIPDRIGALEGFVRSTPGFESWRADLSRDSLRDLGPWFLGTVERRKPTEEDLLALPNPVILNPDLPEYIAEHIRSRPPRVPWVYADRPLAKSVLVDIGTYLCECLRSVGSRCKWGRCKDKSDYNYNQPMLLWPLDKSTGINPVRVGDAIAWKMVENKSNRDAYANALDECVPLATWEPPKYEPIPQREGTPVTTNCPKCGFGFARVKVAEGVYCNHCGHLETSDGA